MDRVGFFCEDKLLSEGNLPQHKKAKEGQGILPLQGTKGNFIENSSFCIEYPLCVLALILEKIYDVFTNSIFDL